MPFDGQQGALWLGFSTKAFDYLFIIFGEPQATMLSIPSEAHGTSIWLMETFIFQILIVALFPIFYDCWWQFAILPWCAFLFLGISCAYRFSSF